MRVNFRTSEETRIAFAAFLESTGELEETRRIYNHPKKAWYRFHLKQLQRMGLLSQDYKPLLSSQSFIYAYTDIPWEEAQHLSEEECKQAAINFLNTVKVYDFMEYLI